MTQITLPEKSAKSILLTIFIITSVVATSAQPVAADPSVDAITFNADESDDRDGDDKYSQFDLSVTADTRVGGTFDGSDPYIKIYINGNEYRQIDDVESNDFETIYVSFSRDELSNLESGELNVKIELWDDDFVTDNLEATHSENTWFDFEPSDKDYTKKQRALIGINSFEEPYSTIGPYLNVDKLKSEQVKYVDKAFQSLIPLSSTDVRDGAAIELLKKYGSEAAGEAIDVATTVPDVAVNVGESLETGRRANTLIKTDTQIRNNFHRNLDQLQSSTSSISIDSSSVDDEALRERKKHIRETYNSLRAYRAATENTYDEGLQNHLPDSLVGEFIEDWYAADEDSLKKVNGHFDQLEQLLIADYYYTQRALTPNQQGTNLEVATTGKIPSFPRAQLVSYNIPDKVTVGKETTISVTTETKYADTPSQTITVGIPDDDNVKDIDVSKNTISKPSYEKIFDPGSELWGGYGESKQNVPYTVVETAGKMEKGAKHTLEISFTPSSTGDVRFWFKSIAWTNTGNEGGLSPYPRQPPESDPEVVADGQDELAIEKQTTVVEPKDPAKFDVSIQSTNAPVTAGGTLKISAKVKNTGDKSDTKEVELNVPNVGSDSTRLSLSGGESQTETFSVSTAGGDDSNPTAEVSSPDDSATRDVTINERPDPANFDVSIQSSPTSITAGENLEVTAKIENTGDKRARQAIELDVPGVGDDSTSVRLDGGGSTQETLSVTTAEGDAGRPTIEVSSADDSANTGVTINEQPDAANFDVNIQSTNAPVTAGERLEVTANIKNTGDKTDWKVIDLTVPGIGGDSQQVQLAGGNSEAITLSVGTSVGDAGSLNSKIESPDDSASQSVTINEQPDPANFDVSIQSSPTSITAGENLEVTAKIENTGDKRARQAIELDVLGVGDDSTSVQLDSGDSTRKTLTVATAVGDAGSTTIEVSSDDDSANKDVTINEQPDSANFDVNIQSTNAPVTAGERLEVTANIKNTGDEEGTQDITLKTGGSQADTESLTLVGGSSQTIILTYATEVDDAPRLNLDVSTEDSSDSKAVTISTADTSSATLSTKDVTAQAGSEQRIQFDLENTGQQDSGYILNLAIPDEISVTDQSGDGGTWKKSNQRWVWTTISEDEQVTPAVTVAVPDDANREYSVSGEVITDEATVAEATSTLTVKLVGEQTIENAIDTNDNNQVDDIEILQAIEYWRNNEAVPSTGGKTISDIEILELIEMWRNGTEVSES